MLYILKTFIILDCFDMPRIGMCFGMFVQRWFFNSATGGCFRSQGCHYQGFMTVMECNKECRCKQPLNEGAGSGGINCELELQKYAFVAETCQPFMFTGCGGNGNRFNSMQQCMSTCKVRELELLDMMGEYPHLMMQQRGMGWNSGSNAGGFSNGQMTPGNMHGGGMNNMGNPGMANMGMGSMGIPGMGNQGMGNPGMGNQGMGGMGMGGMGNPGIGNMGMGSMGNQGMGGMGMGSLGNAGMGSMRNQGMGGMGNPGMGNMGNPGMGSMGNQGMGNPGMGNQGLENLGMGNQGMRNPGMGNQGMGNQGIGNQGMGHIGNQGMRKTGMGSTGNSQLGAMKNAGQGGGGIGQGGMQNTGMAAMSSTGIKSSGSNPMGSSLNHGGMAKVNAPIPSQQEVAKPGSMGNTAMGAMNSAGATGMGQQQNSNNKMASGQSPTGVGGVMNPQTQPSGKNAFQSKNHNFGQGNSLFGSGTQSSFRNSRNNPLYVTTTQSFITPGFTDMAPWMYMGVK